MNELSDDDETRKQFKERFCIRNGRRVWILPKNKIKKCCARMAEWSKAVDLSPTISGCAGSNPASRIFYTVWPL